MTAFIFYAFLAFILYRLVFGFIIPVARTYRRARRAFRDIHGRMEQQHSARPGPQASEPPPAAQGSRVGEYIDFEEIK